MLWIPDDFPFFCLLLLSSSCFFLPRLVFLNLYCLCFLSIQSPLLPLYFSIICITCLSHRSEFDFVLYMVLLASRQCIPFDLATGISIWWLTYSPANAHTARPVYTNDDYGLFICVPIKMFFWFLHLHSTLVKFGLVISVIGTMDCPYTDIVSKLCQGRD